MLIPGNVSPFFVIYSELETNTDKKLSPTGMVHDVVLLYLLSP